MGISCLSSLAKMSVNPVRIVLHDDGSLTDADTRRLEADIPGARVLPRVEADERVEALLHRHPVCLDYRRRTPIGLKLFDTALLSDGDLAYCDTDILFLKPFVGLFDWQASSHRFVAMEDVRDAYSVWPWHVLGKGALRLPRRFNAGLMFVRLDQVYDLDFVEWFLGQRKYWCERIDRLEQTCWAAMSRKYDGRKWAPEQVAMVTDESVLTSSVVAAHFAGTKRHLLEPAIRRLSAMPAERQGVVEVRTVEDQPCRPWELGAWAMRHELGMARHAVLIRMRSRASTSTEELVTRQNKEAHRVSGHRADAEKSVS
jgi:hypothetical protein